MCADTGHYRYWNNPKIRLFPRDRENLLRKEFDENRNETGTECPELKDILYSYEDGNEYSLAGKRFKNIEERIYLDLWKSHKNGKYTVSKKICIGFLYEKGEGKFEFTDEQAFFYTLELRSEISGNSGLTTYLEANDKNNSSNPDSYVTVNMNNVKNRIQEVNVVIQYDNLNSFSDGAELVIKTRFSNSKKETVFRLPLYRNNQSSLDDFKMNGKRKDTDFLVIPRCSINDRQASCIKQLEIINNQVFARNKKFTDFEFVRENGKFQKNDGSFDEDSYNHLTENIGNSIEYFKTDMNDKNKGCRSGNKIGEIEIKYDYLFFNYGHSDLIIKYIIENYDLKEEEVKKRIVDRTFLFGSCVSENPNSKYEGVVNLYRNVVIPFINNFRNQLLEFYNFNHIWLSCPYYNKDYQRGPLTIVFGMSKTLIREGQIVNLANEFQGYTGNNMLPIGTVIKFYAGKDEHAFDFTEKENAYRVRSIKIPNYSEKNYLDTETHCYIKLNYADKKKCNDKDPECETLNLGNYTSTTGLSDSRDVEAVSGYNNFGIPYWVNQKSMKKVVSSVNSKMTKTDLFNWAEDQLTGPNERKNWYSYEKKPNTEAFGIDCSGLVLNSILEIFKGSVMRFSSSSALNNVRAYDFGSIYCRNFNTDENSSGNSYLTLGDIIYTDSHIGVGSDGEVRDDYKNSYVSKSKFTTRYYNAIHNYGHIPTPGKNCAIYTSKDGKYENLFSCKTICGPVRHWGIPQKDINFGRIYIWT